MSAIVFGWSIRARDISVHLSSTQSQLQNWKETHVETKNKQIDKAQLDTAYHLLTRHSIPPTNPIWQRKLKLHT